VSSELLRVPDVLAWWVGMVVTEVDRCSGQWGWLL